MKTSGMRGWEWLVIVAVTVGGGAARLVALGDAPPGFYFDEAVNGVAALEVLAGARPMLYGFDVREPLYIYTTSLFVGLLGPTIFAERLAAALYGTATIPLLYLLGRRLFGPVAAVVATVLLAFSFWHLEMSRFGVRSVTVPFVATLAFYFWWRGLHADRSRSRLVNFGIAGAALGLGAYTYISIRALPLVLVGFVAWQAIVQRRQLWQLIAPYAVAALVAAAVAAPMAVYMAQHPGSASARSDRISLLAAPNPASAIAENAAVTVGMLFWRGDSNPRHNVPDRPALDAVGAALLAVGIAAAVRRWRRPEGVFTVLWAGAMLLPGILSTESPHFIRTLGAAPAVFLLVGRGAGAVLDWSRRRSNRWWATLAVGVIAVWLSIASVGTLATYFGPWAHDPATALVFEVDLARSATYLRGAPPGPTLVFVPSDHPGWHPQAYQYLANRQPLVIDLYDGDQTLLLPPAAEATVGETTAVVVLRPTEPAEGWVAERLTAAELATRATASADGRALYAAYRLERPPMTIFPRPDHQRNIVVENTIAIDGISVSPAATNQPFLARVSPGDVLDVDVHWRVLAPAPAADLRLFIHMLDASGRRHTQDDRLGYPSADWQGGERGITRFRLPLPADAPPGAYTLQFGVYSFATMQRLPVYSDGRPGRDNTVSLGAVEVVPPGP